MSSTCEIPHFATLKVARKGALAALAGVRRRGGKRRRKREGEEEEEEEGGGGQGGTTHIQCVHYRMGYYLCIGIPDL